MAKKSIKAWAVLENGNLVWDKLLYHRPKKDIRTFAWIFAYRYQAKGKVMKYVNSHLKFSPVTITFDIAPRSKKGRTKTKK